MNNEALLHFHFFEFCFLMGLDPFVCCSKMWMNPQVTHCRPTIRSGCWHVRTLHYVDSKDGHRTRRSASSKPSLALNTQATSSDSIVDFVCSSRTSAPQFIQGSSFEFAVCYKREDCCSLSGARGLTDSSGLLRLRPSLNFIAQAQVPPWCSSEEEKVCSRQGAHPLIMSQRPKASGKSWMTVGNESRWNVKFGLCRIFFIKTYHGYHSVHGWKHIETLKHNFITVKQRFPNFFLIQILLTTNIGMRYCLRLIWVNIQSFKFCIYFN